jgi:hypothetical protein
MVNRREFAKQVVGFLPVYVSAASFAKVNPCMPEGQWNTCDLVFEAPKFDGDKLLKPAFITLFFNGVMVHNRAQLLGQTSHEPLAAYTPHPSELPCNCRGTSGLRGIATSGFGACWATTPDEPRIGARNKWQPEPE